VDVRLGHGAIKANLATPLDILITSIAQQPLVDGCERLRLNALDVPLQSGPWQHLVGNAQAAKSAIAARISQMKGQLLVAVSVHLLDDQRAKYLFGSHSLSTAVDLLEVADQIGEDQIGDLGIGVENVADHLQFCGVLVVDYGVDKRQLVV
jgi:hypothetical protein